MGNNVDTPQQSTQKNNLPMPIQPNPQYNTQLNVATHTTQMENVKVEPAEPQQKQPQQSQAQTQPQPQELSPQTPKVEGHTNSPHGNITHTKTRRLFVPSPEHSACASPVLDCQHTQPYPLFVVSLVQIDNVQTQTFPLVTATNTVGLLCAPQN